MGGDDEERTVRDRPGNNQAQNRQFRQATEGLTRAEKERIRRIVERDRERGIVHDYRTIKEEADRVKGERKE
jgi:hypothetical protein